MLLVTRGALTFAEAAEAAKADVLLAVLFASLSGLSSAEHGPIGGGGATTSGGRAREFDTSYPEAQGGGDP